MSSSSFVRHSRHNVKTVFWPAGRLAHEYSSAVLSCFGAHPSVPSICCGNQGGFLSQKAKNFCPTAPCSSWTPSATLSVATSPMSVVREALTRPFASLKRPFLPSNMSAPSCMAKQSLVLSEHPSMYLSPSNLVSSSPTPPSVHTHATIPTKSLVRTSTVTPVSAAIADWRSSGRKCTSNRWSSSSATQIGSVHSNRQQRIASRSEFFGYCLPCLQHLRLLSTPAEGEDGMQKCEVVRRGPGGKWRGRGVRPFVDPGAPTEEELAMSNVTAAFGNNKKVKRVKDVYLDRIIEAEKKTKVLERAWEFLSKQPNYRISLKKMGIVRRQAGFANRGLKAFFLHYTDIYAVTAERDGLYVQFTPEAAAEVQRRRVALAALEPLAVENLRKMLMLTDKKILLIESLSHVRRELLLPDGFEVDFVHRHPKAFRYVDTWNGPAIILTEAAENPDKYVIEPTSRPSANLLEAEIRRVQMIRQLLLLTRGKRLLIDQITHFRKDLRLSQSVKGLLLRHQDVFYVSEKGTRNTVFLREKYGIPSGIKRRGRSAWLIELDPVEAVMRGLDPQGTIQQADRVRSIEMAGPSVLWKSEEVFSDWDDDDGVEDDEEDEEIDGCNEGVLDDEVAGMGKGASLVDHGQSVGNEDLWDGFDVDNEDNREKEAWVRGERGMRRSRTPATTGTQGSDTQSKGGDERDRETGQIPWTDSSSIDAMAVLK